MNECRVIPDVSCPGDVCARLCVKYVFRPMTDEYCREMPTRRCPGDGCDGLSCARYEDDDPWRHIEPATGEWGE